MTPEAKIKRAIKSILDNYNSNVYYYMPVPSGYGSTVIDYIGFACGCGFAIEAKRPGGEPTPRQEVVIERMRQAGAVVFVVNGPESLDELDKWLTTVVGETKGC